MKKLISAILSSLILVAYGYGAGLLLECIKDAKYLFAFVSVGAGVGFVLLLIALGLYVFTDEFKR